MPHATLRARGQLLELTAVIGARPVVDDPHVMCCCWRPRRCSSPGYRSLVPDLMAPSVPARVGVPLEGAVTVKVTVPVEVEPL